MEVWKNTSPITNGKYVDLVGVYMRRSVSDGITDAGC